MRLFGLIGFPLTHSFSKRYFTEKFEREGKSDCHYELFPLPSSADLPRLLKEQPDLQGLNVTIPYKQDVLGYLHGRSEVVQDIGACNCIRIRDGRLEGFNTDVTGFEQSLISQLLPGHDRALILGTGGSSRAVEYVLRKLGIPYRHVSRKPSVNNYSYEQLTPALLAGHRLIINTTPLGMYPAVHEAAPIPYEAITPDHYLFDLVYNPEKTLFLRKGEERGARIRNGHDMLVIQAEESWKIWKG